MWWYFTKKKGLRICNQDSSSEDNECLNKSSANTSFSLTKIDWSWPQFNFFKKFNFVHLNETKKDKNPCLHLLTKCFLSPVSTALTCPLTNRLRTWERNSSWLWRTLRASRGSTKKKSRCSLRLHPANQRWIKKKNEQNTKPQGCQTSCCSSSVQACCTVNAWLSHLHSTVVWDCTAICRAVMPTSLYLFSAGGSLLQGAGERTGESQRRLLKSIIHGHER